MRQYDTPTKWICCSYRAPSKKQAVMSARIDMDNPSQDEIAPNSEDSGAFFWSVSKVMEKLRNSTRVARSNRGSITCITRISWLRWSDRPLAKLLGLQPRYISNRVKKVQSLPRYGYVATLRRWLWLQPIETTCHWVLMWIAIDLILIATALGQNLPAATLSITQVSTWIIPGYFAVFAYLGALFGFLQAVLVFSSNTRWVGGVTLQPLTSYVIRQNHAFEVLALTGGLAVANLAVLFLYLLQTVSIPVSHIEISSAVFVWMTLIDLVLVPITTALSLRLLARIFSQTTGSGDVAPIMPVLRSLMSTALADGQRMSAIAAQFPDELEALGIRYDAFAQTSLSRDRDRRRSFEFGSSMKFIDLDLVAAEQFMRTANQLIDEPQIKFAALPGEGWSDKHGAVLVVPERSADPRMPEENVMRRLTRRLRKSVVFGELGPAPETSQLRRLHSAVGGTLEVFAREERHVELKAGLESLIDLLDAWLDIAPSNTEAPVRPMWARIEDWYSGPPEIDLYGLVETAAHTDSPTVIEVVQSSLAKSAAKCMHRGQFELMHHYLKPLVYMYYRLREASSLDSAGKRLDSLLDSFFVMTTAMDDSDEEKDGAFMVVLNLAMSLTRAAIETCQPIHADQFAERILLARTHMPERERGVGFQPVSVTKRTCIDYSQVLLLGWSLDVLGEAAEQYGEAALAVLKRVVPLLPAPAYLIAEWELLHRESVFHGNIDADLGITTWDVRDIGRDYRTGISVARSGGDEWRKQGFLAGLLLSREPFYGDIESLCADVPDELFWNSEAEQAELRKIAAIDHLGIPEAGREQRIDAAVSLISKRARTAKSTYLRYVLEAEPTAEKMEQFRTNTIESWKKHRPWIDAFVEPGNRCDGDLVMPEPAIVAGTIPKCSLLEKNNFGSTGYGVVFGETAGKHESMNLLGMIERRAESWNVDLSLATFPDDIKQTIQELIHRGYKPNAIVLPRNDRYSAALFRKPVWEIDGRQLNGDAGIGVWEGISVFRYPYSNPESVLVLDTRSLLGSSFSTGVDQIQFEFDQIPSNTEATTAREAAQTALDDASQPLPDHHLIEVSVRVTVKPSLRLCDPGAMLKLSILNSDACYAVIQKSETYHRPTCDETELYDVEFISHLPSGSQLIPCESCRPDQWDAQSRGGVLRPPTTDQKTGNVPEKPVEEPE